MQVPGVVLALLAGCAGEQATSTVVPLASLYKPPATLELGSGDARSYGQSFPLSASRWEPQPEAGIWRSPAPWYEQELPVILAERAGLVIEGDMAIRHTPLSQGRLLEEAYTFTLVREEDGDYLYLLLPDGVIPGEAEVSARVSAGKPGGVGWRVAGGAVAAEGFVLRPDAPAVFNLDVPPGARLILDTVCVGDPQADELIFTVRLDGEVVDEVQVSPSSRYAFESHSIDLPSGGRAGVRFELEVQGEAWFAAIEPRICAREPEPAPRPDIVIFLADTFRADNLALHGGEPGLTPNLDEFAEECLRFQHAWAPSCWTLPSHASLFLGAYPLQHGATSRAHTPGKGLITIAGRLRAAGYRTVAITDSLFVSRHFGLDRGFDRFEEYRFRNMERTLRRARAIGAEDDGRPLFLFVHTYRTHEPYEVSDQTRASLGESLGIEASWDELKEEVVARLQERARAGDEQGMELFREGDFVGLLRALGLDDPDSKDGSEFIAHVRALYRGGAHDLDRGFGQFLKTLDARARAQETWVLFTSDHGEAFNEHGSIFHGAGTWEENLHIPLLIRGPGLAPQTIEHAASLVDLPQTIAEIASIAPHPRWGGRSLLSVEESRPVFAFDCAQRGDPSGALLEDGLKVVFSPSTEAVERREVLRAFDLLVDPGEREDLAGQPRPRTALESLAGQALDLMRPMAPPGRAELDASAIRAMQAAGYMGED